jgi:hypothetical protein
MNIRNAFVILGLSLASGAVYAGSQVVPEPGMLELLAIGAVAAVAVAVRKRRNK